MRGDRAWKALLDPTLNGEAWIDLARLDEAERVLARPSPPRGRRATRSASWQRRWLLRARWRGHAEAGAALGAGRVKRPPSRAAHAAWGAHRVGLRDVNRAMSLVLRLARRPRTGPPGNAAVSFTAALVHLAVGDFDAVERDISESCAARAAHDPLRPSAALLRAEANRARPSRGCGRAMERLRRIRDTPPALRARWDRRRPSRQA
jgi:hypothetical protein